VKVYAKLDVEPVGLHFKSYEFDCPCDNCGKTLIDQDLVIKLDKMRGLLGCSLKITSGYRCQHYQDVLKAKGYETAKTVSQHTLGKAADVTTGVHTGQELADVARAAGFKAIGTGKHFVHVDTRPGPHKWSYGY
jgi:uncharacterized protein YcbK (DUF882 family)